MGQFFSLDHSTAEFYQNLSWEGHSLADIRAKIEAEDYEYLAKFGDQVCDVNKQNVVFLRDQCGDGTLTDPMVQATLDLEPASLNICAFGNMSLLALHSPAPYNEVAKHELRGLAQKMPKR